MVSVISALLQAAAVLAGGCLTVMMLYQLYLSLFGFGRKIKDYADHDPQSRFLVLVPAHNEEKVIGDIIENLNRMDYPRELYDYYIIADNCTDDTAQVAREMGAKVIETRKESPDAPTGKPIALRKALQAIGDYQNRYDLMMIFDADNLMDTNMFREVNSQYLDKGRPDFIQCYLGAKNKKGIVAWFYYTGYTLTNRFFDLAKHRLGLNCAIGGTGFAMSTAYLCERGGWTTMSLTEDFEIQVEATLEGRRILWNHVARVYDEKPTSMRASIRQKIRWGQGHWFVALHNTGKLFRALFSGKIGFGEFFSLLTYMYSISAYVLALVQAICLGLLMLINRTGLPAVTFDWRGFTQGAVLFTYSYMILFYLADWLDNGIAFSFRTLPVMAGGFAANMIVGAFNQLVGLARCGDQQHWVKTEHAISRKTLQAPQRTRMTQKAA